MIYFSQSEGRTKIWEECCPLEWTDFSGAKKKGFKWEAASAVGLKVFDFEWTGKRCIGTVVAFFDKTNSWTEIYTDEGLSHEQGHFDLTEIYARILRKKLSRKIFLSSSISKKIDQIYDQCNRELAKIQEKYDMETQHHCDRIKQAEWDKKN